MKAPSSSSLPSPLKPLDAFPYVGDRLHAEQCAVTRIVEAVGSPVYIYSTRALHESFESFKSAIDQHVPDNLICYAVKANSNLSLLNLFREWGAGFDLVSGGELARVRQVGSTPQRVVFSGVGKTGEEMATALQWGDEGIYSFNVESVEEIKLLETVAASLGRRARVAFRINPNVDAKTHPYIATGLKKNKFGLSVAELQQLVPWLRKSRSIRAVGLSMHIGSQILTTRPFEDACTRMAQTVEAFESALGMKLEFVDVGGGIGVPYRNESTPSLVRYAQSVAATLGPRGLGRRVLFEPGRLLTANAGILATQVLFKKVRRERRFLVVDAGMNDLMRPALYGSFHGIVPVHRKRGGLAAFDVVGPVCESSDCFAQARPLPSPLKAGDLVALLSAGAYGFSMASTYNTRPRPAEVLVDGDRFKVVRPRETLDALLRDEIAALPSELQPGAQA